MQPESPDNSIASQLSAYLDGELDEPDRLRVEGALEADAEMRRLLAELRATRALLRGLPHEQAPDDVLAGIQHRLRLAATRPAARLRWLWWVGAVSAAACVALAAGLAWWFLPEPQTSAVRVAALTTPTAHDESEAEQPEMLHGLRQPPAAQPKAPAPAVAPPQSAESARALAEAADAQAPPDEAKQERPALGGGVVVAKKARRVESAWAKDTRVAGRGRLKADEEVRADLMERPGRDLHQHGGMVTAAGVPGTGAVPVRVVIEGRDQEALAWASRQVQVFCTNNALRAFASAGQPGRQVIQNVSQQQFEAFLSQLKQKEPRSLQLRIETTYEAAKGGRKTDAAAFDRRQVEGYAGFRRSLGRAARSKVHARRALGREAADKAEEAGKMRSKQTARGSIGKAPARLPSRGRSRPAAQYKFDEERPVARGAMREAGGVAGSSLSRRPVAAQLPAGPSSEQEARTLLAKRGATAQPRPAGSVQLEQRADRAQTRPTRQRLNVTILYRRLP